MTHGANQSYMQLCKPGSRNVSQEGRGCLVGDQGGSDKVAQFKMEGLRSGSAVPPLDPRMLLFTEGLETKWDFKFY